MIWSIAGGRVFWERVALMAQALAGGDEMHEVRTAPGFEATQSTPEVVLRLIASGRDDSSMAMAMFPDESDVAGGDAWGEYISS